MITTLATLALLAADDDWNFKLSLGFDASGDAQTVTNFRVDIEGDQKTEEHTYETLLRIQRMISRTSPTISSWLCHEDTVRPGPRSHSLNQL